LSFITSNWSQNKRDNEVMGMEETDTGSWSDDQELLCGYNVNQRQR